MKASDYIVSFLEAQGIEYVFGYQGGMITHLVDSLSRSDKIKFVQCYHEQSAAFAAEGYARATGKFGVCITTSGPGATNAITGIGDAFFDSIPVLYITGQVNSYEYKYDAKVRQRGFQETDIVSVVRPIVKWAKLADDPAELAEVLEDAVFTMMTGRKGPVLIDLPMNVQRSDMPPRSADDMCVRLASDEHSIDDEAVKTAMGVLGSAKRPLVLCGGGIASRAARRAVLDFLRHTRIPYVVSLMGKGLVSEDDDLFLGMIGSYGNRAANYAFSEADVVLCLGTRLDSRQTGNRKSAVLDGITFIRVDVDESEVATNPLARQVVVNADVHSFLCHRAVVGFKTADIGAWRSRVADMKVRRSQREDVEKFAQNTRPYDVLSAVSEVAGDNALFVSDIGQNQMWSAQMIKVSGERGFFTSGGMAPMGYAIPVAVGAAFADPGRQVVCICGDGGFHIALQSLMLVSQYGLRVSVIVMNNKSLGMITQFQSLYFGGNMAGTTAAGGYLVPEIEHIAAAYGIPYRRIEGADQMTPELLCGPAIVEVDLGGLTTVVPKLEFNKSLDNMTPSWPLDERLV